MASSETKSTIKTLVFIDFEATGLQSYGAKPKITELSLVAVHRALLMNASSSSPIRVVDKLTLCVYPMKQISHMSSQITGLYNDNLYYQKDFDPQLVKLLKNFLDRHESPICLIAHNGNKFDFPLLKNELISIDEDLGYDILCADSLVMLRELDATENNSRVVLGNSDTPILKSHSLSERTSPIGPVKRKLEFDGNVIYSHETGRRYVVDKRIATKLAENPLLCVQPSGVTNDNDSESHRPLKTANGDSSSSEAEKSIINDSSNSSDVCVQSQTFIETSSVPDSLLVEAEALYQRSNSHEDDTKASDLGESQTCVDKNSSESFSTEKPPNENETKTNGELQKITPIHSAAMNANQNDSCMEFQGPPVLSRKLSEQSNEIQRDSLKQNTPNSSSSPYPKKSFKLGVVYERVVRKPMENAHTAEADCLALMRICQVLSKDVCSWLDKNAQPWTSIEPMYPQSPSKRKPLSPGRFPYHDQFS